MKEIGLHYISSHGLHVVSIVCLHTLGYGFVSHCLLGSTWREIVLEHGFLVALLAAGRSCYYCYNLLSSNGASTVGQSSDFMSNNSQQVTTLATLGLSFVIMSLTNRLSIVCIAYFMIGYTSSALLGDFASPLTNRSGIGGDFECHDHIIAPNRSTNGDNTIGYPNMGVFSTEAERLKISKVHAKMSIYAFIVSALLASLLYDDDKLTAKPAFIPFFCICILCFGLSALFIAGNERIFHRRASGVGRMVALCISISKVIYTAVSTILLPLLDYFPSLALYDDDDENDTTNDIVGNSTTSGNGATHSATVRANVGEKDLLLDVFNNLTGESDGRPLEINQGPVPNTFVRMMGGDLEEGRKAYSKCLQWRRTFHVDQLCDIPQHDFFEILQMSPHAIHGMSKDGCAIVYELICKGNSTELQKRQLRPEKLVRHFMMRNEYIYKRLYNNQDLLDIADKGYKGPSSYDHLKPGFKGGASGAGGGPNVNNTPYGFPDGLQENDFPSPEEWISRGGVFNYCPQRLMTIVDVNNISVGDINTDMISFLRQTAEIGDQYYPEVVQRLVIVNAPYWFETVWRMVSNVLPESVQQKIAIFHGIDGLLDFVDKDQLPVEYGGTDPTELGQHPDHKLWLGLVDEWEAKTGNHVLRFHEIEEANAKAAEDAKNGGNRGRSRTRSRSASRTRSRSNGSTDSGSSKKATFTKLDSGSDEEETSGWRGWWRSRMKGPKEAHLGNKSPYTYDQEAGRWVIGTEEDDDEYGTSGPKISEYQLEGHSTEESGLRADRSRMTHEKLEEHGLVLAIQAAHHASSLGKSNSSPRSKGAIGASWGNRVSNSPRNYGRRAKSGHDHLAGLSIGGGAKFGDFADRAPLLGGGSNDRALTSPSSPRGGRSQGGSSFIDDFGGRDNGNISPTSWGNNGTIEYENYAHYLAHENLLKVCRACGIAFWLCGMVFAGLLCVIPVWLMSPLTVGGRGYSVLDLGCVFSCAGLMSLQCHVHARWRLRRVAQVSPVRALRIAAGALCLGLFALSYIGSEAYWLDTFVGDDVVFRPSNTMFAVPIPAILIVFTIWSAHYLRQSTECLYLLTRQQLREFEWEYSKEHSSDTADSEPEFDLLPHLVAITADLAGPLILSWLLVCTHGSSLPYPMDSGFFMPACATLAFTFYMCSLLLSLQFVGDFGVIPDDPIHEAGMGALGDFYLLLGKSARSSESTFVGSRLFNLKLSMSKEIKEV
jgi:hypothetical protein